jgi:ATP-dependent RNA helicase MSS116, mitochondrial
MQSASRRGYASLIRTSRALISLSNVHAPPIVRQTSKTSSKLILQSTNAFHSYCRLQSQAAAAEASAEIKSKPDNDLITRFEDLETRGLMSRTIINTITKDMKLETMTPVQAKTINATLKGNDM